MISTLKSYVKNCQGNKMNADFTEKHWNES